MIGGRPVPESGPGAGEPGAADALSSSFVLLRTDGPPQSG
ncbi:hypothetical protein KPATCC21470_0681 [Kitasatospora purpeofusca]